MQEGESKEKPGEDSVSSVPPPAAYLPRYEEAAANGVKQEGTMTSQCAEPSSKETAKRRSDYAASTTGVCRTESQETVNWPVGWTAGYVPGLSTVFGGKQPVETDEQGGIWQLRNFPTLFGTITESSFTVCLDTSGSMYNSLTAIKEHLIEILFQKAQQANDCKFNLIEFGTDVTQWSDKMVQCTPQTVAVAAEWISKLEVKTGSNMLDALVTACHDEDCEAVVLVTDGNPDQHPTDILDTISYAAHDRPVHCYYVQDGANDQTSVEFLEDLAKETFGSIHVVTVTQHGSIDRVTPVYRADHTAERIIRTSHGHVYPSNLKECSVSTTLKTPPQVLVEPAAWAVDPSYPDSMYPWDAWQPYCYNNYGYVLPYRSRVVYPHGGWSRFRHIRGWEKYVQDLQHVANTPPVAPGPGSLLIDTQVLARRNEDGYYYMGKVKSQILSNKFLIEFGPNKHGKYLKTSYQETFVYDLISLTDGLRHAVMVGDKVLAPWEPEGKRYSPGVVLDGQEKRTAVGGPEDSSLTVSFSDGKSCTVPGNTAVWIPPQLHERITFELQLPTNVRQEFTAQLSNSNAHQAEGYLKGESNVPEYQQFEPQHVHLPQPFAPCWTTAWPHYRPLYPIYYKDKGAPSAVRRDQVADLIPGTELTKDQLSERVNQQLNSYHGYQHKVRSSQLHHARSDESLARSARSASSDKLRKSVTFEDEASEKQQEQEAKAAEREDEGSDIEAEYYSGDLEFRDSGHGTDGEDADEQDKYRDVGVGTHVHVPYRRRLKVRPQSADSRPQWKYWGNDPTPDLIEPMHYGPYRVGPYDETAVAAPLELRHGRIHKDGLEMASSLERLNEPMQRDLTVADCMTHHYPRPPSAKPPTQTPGVEFTLRMGSGDGQQKIDRQRADRLSFRKRQVLARQQYWMDKRAEDCSCKEAMLIQHRDRTLQQRQFELNRRKTELDKVQHQRDSKSAINQQLRLKWEVDRAKDLSHDRTRLDALRARRELREQQVWLKSQELELNKAKAQAVKRDHVQFRNDQHTHRILVDESRLAAQDVSKHKTHMKRIEHYHQMEQNAQKMRQLRGEVRNQAEALFRTSMTTC